MLNIETVTTKEQFYSLKDKWNSLLKESSANNVYLTWEWLYTWWEIYGDSIRHLNILTVKDNDEIVAIAPLITTDRKKEGLFTLKSLEFLGTGEDEKDEVCSNYINFIVKNDAEDIYKAIFNYIQRGLEEKQWDRVFLSSVPYSSATITFFSNGIKQNLGKGSYLVNISGPIPCAIISLLAEWDAYLRYISKMWRDKIKKWRRDIASNGDIQSELVTEPDKILTAFNDFVNLHQKRWQDIDEPGLFSSSKFTDFHRKILKLFSDNRWVRIRLLKCNGKTIAASYNFNFDKTIYSYSSAYDRNFKTKVAIGLLERTYDIEDAIRDGYKYYDFYKAKEGSYKWHLAKDKREVCDISIYNKNYKFYLSAGIRYMKASVRRIKNLCFGKRN